MTVPLAPQRGVAPGSPLVEAEPRRDRASGPVLFARYAFGPNRLGLCGPEDWKSLLELGRSGSDDRGIRALAQGFEGAYPYLELLARESEVGDPLDRRVVEGYWLGAPLPRPVGAGAMARSMEERFRGRMRPESWRWLSGKPAEGARPHHAFHVLDVFPRLGLLRGEHVSDSLKVMDSCRIRWGRVLEIDGASLVVSAPPLGMAEGKLVLGEPRVQTVQRWYDGTGFVEDVTVGDVVSVHWDWACDRLEERQLAALVQSTREQLELTNRTI